MMDIADLRREYTKGGLHRDELPLDPLCRDDCPGLCQDCGGKLADLPADHAHEKIDPRWADLTGWTAADEEADEA